MRLGHSAEGKAGDGVSCRGADPRRASVLLVALTLAGCHLGFEAFSPAFDGTTVERADILAELMIARLDVLATEGALRPVWVQRCRRRRRRGSEACRALRRELNALQRGYQTLERAADPAPQRRVIAWVRDRLPPPPDCSPSDDDRVVSAAIMHQHLFTLRRPRAVSGDRCILAPTTAGWAAVEGGDYYGIPSYDVHENDDGTRRVVAIGNYDGCGQPEMAATFEEADGVIRITDDGSVVTRRDRR